MDFGIERVYYAIEAKDNNYKIRIDMENLKAVYSSLTYILGDNLNFFLNSLKYAYKILVNNFISWMDNWNGNEQLLQIESIFLNYTKLLSELHTAGKMNKDLKAYAFYGLYVVEFIRGEYDPSLKYILNAYVVNPRISRYKLCNDLFKFCFYPLISDELKMYLSHGNNENLNIEIKNIPIDLMRQLSDLRRYRLEEIEQKIDYQCICIAEEALQVRK
jgi:hypothetical protein